jgi:hypothetical protein
MINKEINASVFLLCNYLASLFQLLHKFPYFDEKIIILVHQIGVMHYRKLSNLRWLK